MRVRCREAALTAKNRLLAWLAEKSTDQRKPSGTTSSAPFPTLTHFKAQPGAVIQPG